MWSAYDVDGVAHVVPREDLRAHEMSEGCWCHPFEEDGVIVHNAMDEREH